MNKDILKTIDVAIDAQLRTIEELKREYFDLIDPGKKSDWAAMLYKFNHAAISANIIKDYAVKIKKEIQENI